MIIFPNVVFYFIDIYAEHLVRSLKFLVIICHSYFLIIVSLSRSHFLTSWSGQVMLFTHSVAPMARAPGNLPSLMSTPTMYLQIRGCIRQQSVDG